MHGRSCMHRSQRSYELSGPNTKFLTKYDEKERGKKFLRENMTLSFLSTS